jgi:transposase
VLVVSHPRRLVLTAVEQRELEALIADPNSSFGHQRRARVVLLSAAGMSGRDIAARLRLSAGQVSRIRGRFARESLRGLVDRPRAGRKDHAVSQDKVELIFALEASAPPPGHGRWSTRLLGVRVGLSSATVAKVLRSRGPSQSPRSPQRGERGLEVLPEAALPLG